MIYGYRMALIVIIPKDSWKYWDKCYQYYIIIRDIGRIFRGSKSGISEENLTGKTDLKKLKTFYLI